MSSFMHRRAPVGCVARLRTECFVFVLATLVAASCSEKVERDAGEEDEPIVAAAPAEPIETQGSAGGDEDPANLQPAEPDTTTPGTPSLRPAAGGELTFLPTPSRTIGAFLVSGPHAQPQADIEAGAAAVEGDRWKLVVVRGGEKGVSLRTSDQRKIFYLCLSLRGRADATSRTLAFVSSGRITCWIGGEMAGAAQAFARKSVRSGDGKDATRVLFRVDASRSLTAVVFAASLHTGPETVVSDSAVLTVADAGREGVARLVGHALDLRITPGLARRDDVVIAQVLRTGACPIVAGDVSVKVLMGERSLGQFDVSSLENLARAPVTVRYPASLVPESPYTLRAELALDGDPFVAVNSEGHTLDGVLRLAGELDRRAEEMKGFDSAAAFARLQSEKVRLAFGREGGPTDIAAIGRSLAEARRALDEAEAGRDFQAGLTGPLERAYTSEIDDSPQPYLAYIPTKCRPNTGPWPMVVYLHGYVPSYDKDAWLSPDPNFNAVMEAEGCILAVPFGRSNTDFLNVGEDDVLRVIDEMKRSYPVDDSRIYLYGYSMGGSGVWTMLGHYPDRFAAAIVLAGRSDYYLWHGLDRRRVPAWKRHIIDADNPIDQARNMVGVPVRVYHGDADYVVKTEQSKRMVARLKELGSTAELHWVRNGSHWSLFDAVMWSRAPVAWVKQHVRPKENTVEFSVTSYHLRYAGGWGARIIGPRRELEPFTLSCERSADGTSLSVGNAESVAVLPRLLGGRRPVAGAGFSLASTDGAALSWNAQHGDDGVAYYTDAWRRPGLRKSATLCGPVKEAFRSPFAVVYGTKGPERLTRALRSNAERFAKEWRDYAKGRPAIYADVEITGEISAKRNLVMFGDSTNNAFIARVASALPVAWNQSSARIGDASFSLQSRGLVFIYPNPLATNRLVVYMSGLYWGSGLPVNHKWDFLPDFIVFENRVDDLDPMDPVNKAVVAGFFDVLWRPKSELTFVTGPQPAVVAPAAD
jgi:poly(3-hydroxybutyrate) depolymerase